MTTSNENELARERCECCGEDRGAVELTEVERSIIAQGVAIARLVHRFDVAAKCYPIDHKWIALSESEKWRRTQSLYFHGQF